MERPEVQVIPDWELTPARAAKLMTANRNRKLRSRQVQAYSREMTAGRWRDYSLIKVAWVDGEGEVFIDGQHRAAAVIHSKVTIKVILVRNVDPEDQDVTDTGLRRKLTDILKLRGEPNYNLLAAAIGWYWRRHGTGMTISDVSPTINEAMELLAEHPDLRHINTDMADALKRFRVSVGMGMCLDYEMRQLADEESVNVFWHRLRYGRDLPEDSSIALLRDRLTKNATARVHHLDRYMICALTIKAWNYYIQGMPMENLRWRRGGAKPEKFPLLVGSSDGE